MCVSSVRINEFVSGLKMFRWIFLFHWLGTWISCVISLTFVGYTFDIVVMRKIDVCDFCLFVCIWSFFLTIIQAIITFELASNEWYNDKCGKFVTLNRKKTVYLHPERIWLKEIAKYLIVECVRIFVPWFISNNLWLRNSFNVLEKC